MDGLNSYKRSREFGKNQRKARNKSKSKRRRRNAQNCLPSASTVKFRSVSSYNPSDVGIQLFSSNTNNIKIRSNDKSVRRFRRNSKKKKNKPHLQAKRLIRRISAPITSPISTLGGNSNNTKPIINAKIATDDKISYIINNMRHQRTQNIIHPPNQIQYHPECKSYNLDYVDNTTVHTPPSLPKSSTSPLISFQNELYFQPSNKTYTKLKKAVPSKKRNKKIDGEFSLQNRKVTRGSFVRNLHKFAIDDEMEISEIAVSMNTEDKKEEKVCILFLAV